MTDKTMPEKIYALQQRTWMEGGSRGGVEYIRADLVPAPSADDPLADGQYRWVEIGGQWIAGKISGSTKHNLYFYDVDGNETPVAALGVIGPVIRPPADTTN